MNGLQRVVPVAAVGALVAAFVAPVPIAAKLSLVFAYLILPLLMTPRRGVAIAESAGSRVVTSLPSWARTDFIMRIVSCLAWLVAAPGLLGFTVDGAAPVPSLFALLIAFATSAMALGGLVQRMTAKPDRMPSVLIEKEAVTVFGSKPEVVRFDDLVEIGAEPSSLKLITKLHGSITVEAESAAVAQDARAAIESAWNEWKASARGAKSAVESMLARPGDASHEAWLGNLDSMAVASQSGAAYRGGGVDEDELWATLQEVNALPDARAAAARLLSRKEESRVRVTEMVRVVADDATRARIEAALKPAGEAAAELEAMEAESIEREIGR